MQYRHFPFRNKYEKIGIRSYHCNFFLHIKQYDLPQKDQDGAPEDQKVHGPGVGFLPESDVGKDNGQERLEPRGPLVRAILFFAEMPQPVVPPPEAQGEKGQKAYEENEKADDDGKEYLHDIDLLTGPETS
ncbi:MAG: hypothetical protein UT77_C0012G0049 [Candidatus Daviesbacteria bacterium GW2011_GWC2_40_12]|uniref:Uncharacterized protein n=1 Tax=Candidatus Daviesbacteria bacterium GW2011_GWC2_40_12 TaxID=1618431 RepID=A0A0G0TU52_9BACT|nr:MAG: hypothetical protein UT77_C0012G0049 [Candidatus Daviesbacteria bacterium GW2011_GWC2_40_12]